MWTKRPFIKSEIKINLTKNRCMMEKLYNGTGNIYRMRNNQTKQSSRMQESTVSKIGDIHFTESGKQIDEVRKIDLNESEKYSKQNLRKMTYSCFWFATK